MEVVGTTVHPKPVAEILAGSAGVFDRVEDALTGVAAYLPVHQSATNTLNVPMSTNNTSRGSQGRILGIVLVLGDLQQHQVTQ